MVDDTNGAKWQDALSYSDKVKISLARAFIVNPEILVLQRPLTGFTGDNAVWDVSLFPYEAVETIPPEAVDADAECMSSLDSDAADGYV